MIFAFQFLKQFILNLLNALHVSSMKQVLLRGFVVMIINRLLRDVVTKDVFLILNFNAFFMGICLEVAIIILLVKYVGPFVLPLFLL